MGFIEFDEKTKTQYQCEVLREIAYMNCDQIVDYIVDIKMMLDRSLYHNYILDLIDRVEPRTPQDFIEIFRKEIYDQEAKAV